MPLTQAAPDALARVYAQSLFELAQSQGGQARIEEVSGELDEILELARADARFNEFLASRILGAGARSRSLDAIFKGRISDLTLNFLKILNHKDRLGHLAPIIAAFEERVQEAFGRIEVDVYTAAPLGQDDLEALRERLRQYLGRDPILHPYTDASMIGGLRLQIGDQLIDASLAARLRKMRERLATTGTAELRTRTSRILDVTGDNGH